jgi:hypothetical protein
VPVGRAAWLVVLALTSQVLGWMLISSSLPRLPAALTSVLLLAQPVGAMAIAALLLARRRRRAVRRRPRCILGGVVLATATRPRAVAAAAAPVDGCRPA